MRTRICILGLIILFITSCSKTEPASPGAGVSPGDNVSIVTISLRKSDTKATSITTPFPADVKIKSLDVFVFEATPVNPSATPVVYQPGMLIGHQKFLPTPPAVDLDTSSPINIATTRGRRFFFVVANDYRNYDAMGLHNYSDVCAVTYSMSDKEQYMWIEGNSTSRDRALLCTGLTEYYLTSSANTVPVSLYRQCSRINIARINNNLPAHFGDVTVKGVFLSNYVDRWPIGGASFAPTTPTYQDQWGIITYADSGVQGVIDEVTVFGHNGMTAIHGNLVIPHDSYSTAYANKGIYAFPNANQNATWWATRPDTWINPSVTPTVWPTRVVLVAALDYFPGRVFYYPMTPSEELKANSTYDITITLENLGTSSAETFLETGSANITVQAREWTVVNDTFVQ